MGEEEEEMVVKTFKDQRKLTERERERERERVGNQSLPSPTATLSCPWLPTISEILSSNDDRTKAT